MSKRHRNSGGGHGHARARRPINKSIKGILQTVSTTQVATSLITSTFPCTVVGIRWEIIAHNRSAAEGNSFIWAIVLVKEGTAADTLSIANGATVYNPEQNVLTWGIAITPPNGGGEGPISATWSGDTKTMRKLQGGDEIHFISLSESDGHDVKGVVQFFCKT